MCDTFVCPSDRSETGHWIFGKNSDREPNEIQSLRQFPARENPSGEQKCTFIKTEHATALRGVIISQPVHMWGAEMGINDRGVTIGNEAVFTKMKLKKKNSGLTGMDMLRLALESCSSAVEALDKIKWLNERYGQDGNGGYQSRFFYHNSFLIADPKEAYVLETAGRFWATEKVKGFRAISNGLSIGKEFEDIHPDAIGYARKKGWSRKGEDFSFSKAFSAFWMPRLAQCSVRKNRVDRNGKSGFGIEDAFSILRSHDSEKGFSPRKAGTGSVCMHAGGLFTPHQTTASLVTELRPEQNHTIWATASSAPCLSIFKPFYFGGTALGQSSMIESRYWERWEEWHRKAIDNYLTCHKTIDQSRHEKEIDWIRKDQKYNREGKIQQLEELSHSALRESEEILRQMMPVENKRYLLSLYKFFWRRMNSKYVTTDRL